MAEPMPTEQDYARAREALSTAHDELDSICFAFAQNLGEDADVVEVPNRSLDPMPAAVGLLFSFVEDVRGQVADLSRFEGKLVAYLQGLDGLRLDLEAARRHARAA